MSNGVRTLLLSLVVLALAGAAAYIGYTLYTTSQAPVPSNAASGCSVQSPAGGTLVVGADCAGKGDIIVFQGDSCPTTQQQIGGRTPVTGALSRTPNPPAGKCEQIDFDPYADPGQGQGVCRCNTSSGGGDNGGGDNDDDDDGAVCGETCETDSDCRPFGANGAPTVCRSGICEAANCDPGKTLPGANCDCQSFSGKCGQRCGTGYPLCGDGTICRYIIGPSCTKPTPDAWTTFCVPEDLDELISEKCEDRDTGNAYLVDRSLNKTSFTQAEILDYCEPVEPPIVVGESNIVITKAGNAVCTTNDLHRINYTITIRNTGDEEAVYGEIVDEFLNLTDPDISGITGTGTLTGSQITWPAGNIAAGGSITLTYTLDLTSSQSVQLATSGVDNRVSVDYDEDKTTVVSENTTLPDCDNSNTLPKTDLRDDLILVTAVLLMIIAALVYRTGLGSDATEMLLMSLGRYGRKGVDVIAENVTVKAKRKKYEKSILEKPE